MNVSGPLNRFKPLLTSLNGDGRYGVALIIVCAVLLLPELTGEWGRAALRYERHAVAAGEWWRLCRVLRSTRDSMPALAEGL